MEDEHRHDGQGAQPVEAGQPPGRGGWSCRCLPVADLCVAPGRGGHGSAVSLHRAHAATVGAGGDRVTEARSWGRTPEARRTIGLVPETSGVPDDVRRMTVFVRGRVQGVGFRWWTRARALELGLVGHARNTDDGRVEVVAEGDCRERSSACSTCWREQPLPTHRRPGRVESVSAPLWGASRLREG